MSNLQYLWFIAGVDLAGKIKKINSMFRSYVRKHPLLLYFNCIHSQAGFMVSAVPSKNLCAQQR